MISKPMGNEELKKEKKNLIEDFAKGAESKINNKNDHNNKPWEECDPTGKRTGEDGTPFMIYLNKYEVELLKAALQEDGGTKTNFIRVAAIKKAKKILDI